MKPEPTADFYRAEANRWYANAERLMTHWPIHWPFVDSSINYARLMEQRAASLDYRPDQFPNPNASIPSGRNEGTGRAVAPVLSTIINQGRK